MVTFDNGAAAPTSDLPAPGFFASSFFNTSHKVIGLRYLWLALASVLFGMLLSLLMRIHLVWPAAHIPFLSTFAATPASYAALSLLHGSLMAFLVLTTAPQAGFGNYFLPLQIGAREVAFPLLNLISFWVTVVSFLGFIASFFITPGAGLTLWTAGVSLFCLGALLTSINFAVTVLDLRATGMTLPRMPLTVWAWFINALLSRLIFVFNFGWTLWRSERLASGNPWRGTTLEWAPATAAAGAGLAADDPVVHRGAYEFFPTVHGQDFTPQWVEHAPAELTPRAPASTSPRSEEREQHLNEQRAK